LAVSGLGGGG
ncbi:host specificity protein J, partial [Escherichia coli ARS4.2123]